MPWSASGYRLRRQPLLLDDPVQLDAQLAEDLVVGVMAEGLRAALEVDVRRRAPHAEVGVVGLAGTVHAATHHSDRDVVLLGVLGHVAHVMGEVDEGLVLDARAGWATDDVQTGLLEAWDGTEASFADVAEDLAAYGDLIALALEGEGQGDADRVADVAGDELFE